MIYDDHLGREINVGDVVFYNAAMYKVVGFSPKDCQVKLNYVKGHQLVKPKLRWCDQVVLVEPEAVTVWLLKQNG